MKGKTEINFIILVIILYYIVINIITFKIQSITFILP